MDNNLVRVLLVDDDEDDYVLTRDWCSQMQELSFSWNGWLIMTLH